MHTQHEFWKNVLPILFLSFVIYLQSCVLLHWINHNINRQITPVSEPSLEKHQDILLYIVYFKHFHQVFIISTWYLPFLPGIYPISTHGSLEIYFYSVHPTLLLDSQYATNNGSLIVTYGLTHLLYEIQSFKIWVNLTLQGWILRIVRLPGTTESNCQTTELLTPLVRWYK